MSAGRTRRAVTDEGHPRSLRERDFSRHYPIYLSHPQLLATASSPIRCPSSRTPLQRAEADEEAVKAELEPSVGDPHRKASRVHFDSLGLDDHRLLLSMTPYVSNAKYAEGERAGSSPALVS